MNVINTRDFSIFQLWNIQFVKTFYHAIVVQMIITFFAFIVVLVSTHQG